MIIALFVELVAPETNFPLEMLALIDSFRDNGEEDAVTLKPLIFVFFIVCHDLLNSIKLFVPPGDPSSSRIRSNANSVLFSFSGIGCPNSAKKRGSCDGEPLNTVFPRERKIILSRRLNGKKEGIGCKVEEGKYHLLPQNFSFFCVKVLSYK